MALTYADGQYQIDGEPADAARVTAFRDTQVERWAEELRLLARTELDLEAISMASPWASDLAWYDEENPGIAYWPPVSYRAVELPQARVSAFASKFLTRVSEMVTSAYVWAAGGVDAVSAAGWSAAARLVDLQANYGRDFIAALGKGTLSPAQAQQRAAMYAGATISAFEAGKSALMGFDAPALPGESCEGLTNCRCFWSIEDFPDRVEATWVAVGDKDTCGWCADNADRWAPLVQEKDGSQ